MLRLARMMRIYVGARRRFRGLGGVALGQYQRQRAQETIAHAIHHSPFYRDHFFGHKPADWPALPTVDKAAMMDHFDTFNTRCIRLDEAMSAALRAERDQTFTPTLSDVTVGLSSGTSGRRGLFLVSPEESLIWAAFIFARALPAPRWRGYRIALFLRSNSNLYEGLGGRWVQFRYFDLASPMAESIAILNDYQPTLLVGPPSLLVKLADAIRRDELRIRPERIVAAAEVLEPQDRECIGGTFDRPVHQIYQCTEGLLALSCPQGSLHVQEDLVAVQFEPMPAEAGGAQRFTPIVTDLWRRTQPIIRYRLGDLVTLSSVSCRCGSAFRVISSVEGRREDVCELVQPGGKTCPIYPETLRATVLSCSPCIEDYDIVQERPGYFRIHLRVGDGIPFDEVAYWLGLGFRELAARHRAEAPILQVERTLIPVPVGVKRQRVRRLASPTNTRSQINL